MFDKDPPNDPDPDPNAGILRRFLPGDVNEGDDNGMGLLLVVADMVGSSSIDLRTNDQLFDLDLD